MENEIYGYMEKEEPYRKKRESRKTAEGYRLDAIKAARDLGYAKTDKTIIDRIRKAQTTSEIAKIMTTARKESN